MSQVASRTPYEQQEFQRKNPHLFTTLTQCVNADGSITTFEHVTRKLRESLNKLQALHGHQRGGPHPDYCTTYLENDLCKAIGYTQGEMGKVRLTFVRNYHNLCEREARRRERVTDMASYSSRGCTEPVESAYNPVLTKGGGDE